MRRQATSASAANCRSSGTRHVCVPGQDPCPIPPDGVSAVALQLRIHYHPLMGRSPSRQSSVARPWRNGGTGILLAVAAATAANCSTDLRRDDLDGRPCPCLDGWECRETTSGSFCVRSNGSGGVSGNAGSPRGGGTDQLVRAGAGGTHSSLAGAGMSGTVAQVPQAGAGNSGNVNIAGSSAIAGAAGATNYAGASGSLTPSTGGDVASGGSVSTGGVSSGGITGTGGSLSSGGTVGTGGSVNAAGGANTAGVNNTAGSAGRGEVSGSAGSAGRASCQPPLPPPASVSNCPSPCTNCDGGVCNIECAAQDDCSIPAMACPTGMPCRATCSGLKSCANLTVTCAAGYKCDIDCSGRQSCSGLSVHCADSGSCGLTCGSSNKACDSATTLSCGGNACHASCLGNVQPIVEGCENSCSYPGCGCN